MLGKSSSLYETGRNQLESKEIQQPKQKPTTKPSETGGIKNQSKAQQIVILKRAFEILNPGKDVAAIDFEAAVDEKLHVSENRDVLAKFYPGYVWRKKSEKVGEPQAKSQDEKKSS